MALGGYAESVVAEALPGSLEARRVTASVDIQWTPRTAAPIAIQVKHSRGGNWNVGEHVTRDGDVRIRGRHADVYVLTSHEGENHRTGWTFYVVPCWRLDGWDRTTISLSRLDRWKVERVSALDLPAAVTAAALRPRNYRKIIRNDQQLRRRCVASRQPLL
jgi:hypothetical protein